MKWVILCEAVLCVLFFGTAMYSSVTAKSADEGIIAAPIALGGVVMVVAIFLTLFGWWMWQVTFRE